MKVKYTGQAHYRRIDPADLEQSGDVLVWTPDSVVDVPDALGEVLVEKVDNLVEADSSDEVTPGVELNSQLPFGQQVERVVNPTSSQEPEDSEESSE